MPAENLTFSSDGQPVLPDIPVAGANIQAGPGKSTPVSKENYTNAAARVAAINSSIASALTFPAGLFKMARENDPVPQDDGSWLWSYSATYEFIKVDAKLSATEQSDMTYWSMKVSVDNPIMPVVDFEWYTGTSTQTNTSGSWQFFDVFAPTEHNPTAKIDWLVEPLTAEADLTIENVDTRTEHVGDVLLYNVNPETASMSYKDVSEDQIWDIVWSVETGAGRITVPGYNNGEKACWDADRNDVVCN